MTHNPFAIVLTLLLASSVPSAQGVWVVDDDGGEGVDFTEIQLAVDAAADGDVVLVRPGSYDPFTIDGKGLTVHGDGSPRPSMLGPLEVTNLPVQGSVTVRGIDVEAVLSSGGFPIDIRSALELVGNAGPIWIEDVRTNTVPAATPFDPPNLGSVAADCASVVFARCELVAIGFEPVLNGPNRGLTAVDSNVSLYDCLVRGGADLGDYPDNFRGSPGLDVIGGSLFVSGCEIEGGDGVDGLSFILCEFCDGGAGGTALVLRGSDPSVSLVDTTLTAGTPGAAGACSGNPCEAGEPGVDLDLQTGTLAEIPGVARAMSSNSPVREGEVATDTWSGAPFDLVVHVFAFGQGPAVELPGITGTTALGLPFFARLKGLLNATGTKVQSVTLGDFGPGVDVVPLYKQTLFLDATTQEVRSGTPTLRLMFDQGL